MTSKCEAEKLPQYFINNSNPMLIIPVFSDFLKESLLYIILLVQRKCSSRDRRLEKEDLCEEESNYSFIEDIRFYFLNKLCFLKLFQTMANTKTSKSISIVFCLL